MVLWHKVIRIVLLAAVLALSACQTAQPTVVVQQPPTQDLNIVRTEAAQTVVAQITADALLNPTATNTPVPPTETALPTEIPTAAATLTPPPTSTKVVSSGSTGGSSGSSGGAYPTRTGTPYTDQAAFVSQSIKDGQIFAPGYDFDNTWTVKNTGFRAWNTQFYLKYMSGDLKPKNNKIYMLSDTVAVRDTVGLTADFVAPSEPGRYTSNWAIINDDGVDFFHMYIVIVVK